MSDIAGTGKGDTMNNRKHHLRCFLETVIILGIVAILPRLHSVLSCNGYPYYDPDPPMDLSRDEPYSLYEPRPIVQYAGNRYAAVFTGVGFPWIKPEREIGGQTKYYVDVDTKTEYDVDYTIADSVRFKVDQNETSPGQSTTPYNDWVDDQSSPDQDILDVTTYAAPDASSFTFTIDVEDTAHAGPPGTTDDTPDIERVSHEVHWEKPNRENNDFTSHDITDDGTYYTRTLQN